jgi:concanavalin A-like lectin/glucanase superfamily protein
MNDNDPALFEYFPLNEANGDRLPDAGPNRGHSIAHQASLVADDQFGKSLQLSYGPDAYVELPRLRLLPFLQNPKFTFMVWIQPDPGGPGNFDMTVLDVGLGPEVQRLKVQLVRRGPKTGGLETGGRPTVRPSTSLSFTALAPAPDRTGGSKWTAETKQTVDKWFHFAFVWTPQGGVFDMFLNGAPMTNYSKAAGDSLEKVSGPAAFQAYIGKPLLPTRLAHLRVYTRDLSREEIICDMEGDRLVTNRFRTERPLDLSVKNQDARPALYVDSAAGAQTLTLQVNPCRPGLSVEALAPNPIADCHFELAFRPGVLLPGNLTEIRIHPSTQDFDSWNIIADKKESRESLRMTRKTSTPIPDSGLTLVLDHLRPDARYGQRPAIVALRYWNLKNGQGEQISGGEQQRLELIDREMIRHTITTLNPLWVIDEQAPPSWSRSATGKIHLTGHCQLPLLDPQKSLLLRGFGLDALDLPADAAPSSGLETYAGHVKCFLAGSPAAPADWSGDIVVRGRTVQVHWKVFPVELKPVAARLDMFLDGISYQS